jgi:hypothetical protein
LGEGSSWPKRGRDQSQGFPPNHRASHAAAFGADCALSPFTKRPRMRDTTGMDISSVAGSATGAALSASPASGTAASIQVSTIDATQNLQENEVNRLFSTLGLGTNASHSA